MKSRLKAPPTNISHNERTKNPIQLPLFIFLYLRVTSTPTQHFLEKKGVYKFLYEY